MKRFNVNPDGTASYTVDEKNVVAVNFARIMSNADLVAQAVKFAIGHVLRNATAGKMEDLPTAVEAVKERAAALDAGKWSEHREGGETGESRTSLLAQAIAEVTGGTPAEGAKFVSEEIARACEDAGIDADADESDSAETKSKRKSIASKVRKGLSEDPAIKPVVARMRAENAAKAAADAVADAKGKTSRFQ